MAHSSCTVVALVAEQVVLTTMLVEVVFTKMQGVVSRSGSSRNSNHSSSSKAGGSQHQRSLSTHSLTPITITVGLGVKVENAKLCDM